MTVEELTTISALVNRGGLSKEILRLILVPLLNRYGKQWLIDNADAIVQAAVEYLEAP